MRYLNSAEIPIKTHGHPPGIEYQAVYFHLVNRGYRRLDKSVTGKVGNIVLRVTDSI
jgi:hypothetical protein